MFFKCPVHNAVYAYAASGYGVVRKSLQVYDAKVPVYDEKNCISIFSRPEAEHKRQPMLVTTKLLLAGMCGLASLYVWPYYVYTDANRLEMQLRSKRPEDYGERVPEHAIDYLFN